MMGLGIMVARVRAAILTIFTNRITSSGDERITSDYQVREILE